VLNLNLVILIQDYDEKMLLVHRHGGSAERVLEGPQEMSVYKISALRGVQGLFYHSDLGWNRALQALIYT
jgi:hypothetical protein